MQLKRMEEKEERKMNEFYRKENNVENEQRQPPKSPKMKKRDPNGKPP